MTLAQTSKAIGAVTELLKSRLEAPLGFTTVSVGRPHQNATKAGFNLFLYEIAFDPHLKNHALDEGQKPPLWLVLKYLLTPNGTGVEPSASDSIKSHEELGRALRLMYDDDFLRLDSTSAPALTSNPENLHLTFDEAPPDLLAKLMQGPDELLRLSIAFQVRPVMIASADPPSYSLLVGVDYTKPSPAPTPDFVGLDVLPSLGPVISEIEPAGFEVGEEVVLRGADLHLSNLSVRLGPIELPVTSRRPDELRFVVDAAVIDGTNLSAGSHPVAVVLTLPTGKRRTSNAVIGNLVPTFSSAAIVPPVTIDPDGALATIDLAGALLGRESDDAVLAFYREGRVVRMFDALGAPNPTQTARSLDMLALATDPASPGGAEITADEAVPPGEYLLILRVNGQQAPQSPRVNLI